MKLITFGLLLSLLTLSKAQSGCNYFQELKAGKSYYIFNEEYPRSYEKKNTCTWRITSPYVIKINCTLEMPESYNCMEDKLTVGFYGKNMNIYCGIGVFEDKGRDVTVHFNSPYYTTGGTFLCEVKAIEFDEDNCQCGWKDLSYIVGGKETGVNEYPMMAGLVDSVNIILYCGATIISQWHVITAVHCLTNKNLSEIGVVIGEHDITTGLDTEVTRLYLIYDCVTHPQYDGKYNDIAICQIIEKIQYGVKIGPACLPFQHRYDSFAGSYAKMLGWGMTSFGGSTSNVLQEVEVEVISRRECTNRYSEEIAHSEICTYADGKDACQMDSGGPVLWENPITHKLVLIGIISSGAGCASDLPAINTRVGDYIEWIMDVTPGVQYCKAE